MFHYHEMVIIYWQINNTAILLNDFYRNGLGIKKEKDHKNQLLFKKMSH